MALVVSFQAGNKIFHNLDKARAYARTQAQVLKHSIPIYRIEKTKRVLVEEVPYVAADTN